jgi:two-component system, NtrC family, response regulator HydG
VELPPLRSRPADVDLLARHFAAILNERYGFRKTISDSALETLRAHAWPGNVRELQHAVESAFVVCDGQEVLPAHLPAAVQAPAVSPAMQGRPAGPFQTIEERERLHIEDALKVSGGHRGQAAKMLGISERNLYRKLRDYGLPG